MRVSLWSNIFRSRHGRGCSHIVVGLSSSSSSSFFSSSVTAKMHAQADHTRSIRGHGLGIERRLSRVKTLRQLDNLVQTSLSPMVEQSQDGIINESNSSSSSSSSSSSEKDISEALYHIMYLSDEKITHEYIRSFLKDVPDLLLHGKALTLAIRALGSSVSLLSLESLDLLIKLMTEAYTNDPTSIKDIHLTAFLKAAKSNIQKLSNPCGDDIKKVLTSIEGIVRHHEEISHGQILLNAYISFLTSIVKFKGGKAIAEKALNEISIILEKRRKMKNESIMSEFVVLNARFYAPIISLCGRLKKYELAEKYHNEMITIDKIEPTSYTYTALMVAAVISNNYDRVLPIFQEMKSKNICPKAYAMNILITSLRRNNNDTDGAFKIFRGWILKYQPAVDWVLLHEAYFLHEQLMNEITTAAADVKCTDDNTQNNKKTKRKHVGFLRNLLLDSMYAYMGYTQYSDVIRSSALSRGSNAHHRFPSNAPPIYLVRKILPIFALKGKLEDGMSLHYKLTQKLATDNDAVSKYDEIPHETWIDISNMYAHESKWKDLMKLNERFKSLSFSSSLSSSNSTYPPPPSSYVVVESNIVANTIAVLMQQSMFLQVKRFLQTEISYFMDNEKQNFDVSSIYSAFQRINCIGHEVPIFFALMKQLNLVTSESLLLTIKNCRNARQLMACIDYNMNEIDDNEMPLIDSMKIQIDFSDEHIDAMSECLNKASPEELHTIFDCLENKYSLPNVLDHVNIPINLKNLVVELRVNANISV